MKQLLQLLLALALFSSCVKKLDTKELSSDNGLLGNWELTKRTGGYAATAADDFPPGNGNKVAFTENTMSLYFSDTLSRIADYSLQKDTSWTGPNPPQLMQRLLCLPITQGMDTFLEVADNKLTIYYGNPATDGFSLQYRRLR